MRRGRNKKRERGKRGREEKREGRRGRRMLPREHEKEVQTEKTWTAAGAPVRGQPGKPCFSPLCHDTSPSFTNLPI